MAPAVDTIRSLTMSASGIVIRRVVKPVGDPLKPPVVIPAPKISSVAYPVVTFPLLALVAVPAADAVLSRGLDASRPLYSVIRTSAYGTGLLNTTVTLFVPAAADLMFGAS